MAIKSYTQQLIDGFVEQGATRLQGLSEQDLGAVIYWLETKQMELRISASDEDDPLENAKKRGGVMYLGIAAAELLDVLKARLAANAGEKDEE